MSASISTECTSLKHFLIIDKFDFKDVLLRLDLPSSFLILCCARRKSSTLLSEWCSVLVQLNIACCSLVSYSYISILGPVPPLFI